jgi:hypothetical protein
MNINSFENVAFVFAEFSQFFETIEPPIEVKSFFFVSLNNSIGLNTIDADICRFVHVVSPAIIYPKLIVESQLLWIKIEEFSVAVSSHDELWEKSIFP